MATHSSVLAWGIPGTGEPGGLPSPGSHRVGHDWSDLAAGAAAVDVKWYIIVVWCAFPIVMNIFSGGLLACLSSSENYLFSSIYSLFSLMNWNEILSSIKLFSNLDLYIASLFLCSTYHFLAYPILFRSWWLCNIFYYLIMQVLVN